MAGNYHPPFGSPSQKAEIFARAGERFAAHNSGGTTLVESAADHRCEYMMGAFQGILDCGSPVAD